MHVDVHKHAEADLEALWDSDPGAAAAVEAVLEQLEADSKIIDKLTTYGDNVIGSERLSVKEWAAAQRKQANLWRFRILDTPATSYRVIYGYHWQTRQICVLAIVPKDGFNYDDLTSPIATRIFADWNDL